MAQPPSADPQGGADSQDPSGQQGQQPPQDAGAGPISQLLDQVGGALQHLEQVFASSKSLPPQDKQLISQIVQMYGELMESISGEGGQEQPEGQAQGQSTPMEAGGNKGAVPAM